MISPQNGKYAKRKPKPYDPANPPRRGPRQVVIPEEPTEAEFDALVNRAFNTAIWHIARYPKTEHEIRGKLLAKSFTEPYIEAALTKLRDYQLVDDSDYAEVYIKSHRGRLGKRGLQQKLQQKGIDKDLLDDKFVSLLEEDESFDSYGTALEMARKKALTYPASLPYEKKYSRLVGLISRRGFANAYEIAKIALSEVEEESAEDFGS